MSPTLVVGIVGVAVGVAISTWTLVARAGRVPLLFGVLAMLSGAMTVATSLVPGMPARLGLSIFFAGGMAWTLIMIYRTRSTPDAGTRSPRAP
jgi:hypothetical protein